MPGISQALRKLVQLLDNLGIPHMLIGGWALPAYGHVRATLDLDLAIAASFPDIQRLHNTLASSGYQLPSPPLREAPMFFMFDPHNETEIEIWTRPDGVEFNAELLRRRIQVKPFHDDFEIFAIGPEDFIVNKLARTDRSVQDEQDVVSVLQRQKNKLDYDYLRRRAREARVFPILQELIEQLP